MFGSSSSKKCTSNLGIAVSYTFPTISYLSSNLMKSSPTGCNKPINTRDTFIQPPSKQSFYNACIQPSGHDIPDQMQVSQDQTSLKSKIELVTQTLKICGYYRS